MTTENEKRPLHSPEAEMSVLGAMLLSDRAAKDIAALLDEGDFFSPAHREIYKSARTIIGRGGELDQITLEDALISRQLLSDVGGPEYLLQLANYTPSASNALEYMRIVQEKAVLRRLAKAGRKIVELVYDPDVDLGSEALAQADKILKSVGSGSLGPKILTGKEMAIEFFDQLDSICETGIPIRGVDTGFVDLDQFMGGMHAGDLVIVGARPAMGKTSFALGIALTVAREKPVLVFSLEMSKVQMTRRLVSMIGGINLSFFKTGRLTDDVYTACQNACETLSELQICITESPTTTVPEMLAAARAMQSDKGLGLIVVDYLQLLKAPKGSRQENRQVEVSAISSACKGMARELGVPVIALSQLNRQVEQRDDKRPTLADLRESGAIENDADSIMFLYRDAYYKAKEEQRSGSENPHEVEEAEVILAKQRMGPVGTVKLGFQPSFARYRSLARSTS